MNFKDLVTDVKKRTGEEYEVCSDIINAYEKYCEEKIKRPFKDEVDTQMINWISTSTTHGHQTVNAVLSVFVPLMKSEVKQKIPFIN
ncbi:hypothetical protein IGI37_001133 [Enterococcus sp. AZ194]|uniref:hypothetical protein n=1 Tax=Enterococcus sp. AZ194 TaxID=2774629 RepID=UPI003F261511